MSAGRTKSPTEGSGIQATAATLKLVLIYAVFAALWILLFDKMVAGLSSDPAQIAFARTLERWLFVAVTSLLLFVLIRRLLDQALILSLRELEAQTERADALQLLATIAENSSDAIFAKDLEGRYLLFNRENARVTGTTAAQALGGDDSALFPLEQAEMIRANDRRVIAENQINTYEETLATVDGERTYLATKGPLRDRDGQVIGLFGISRDITARKASEDRVRHLAHFDALTNLPNRALLTDRLHQALAQARRDKRMLALMFLDLDKFKPVNDTLGHDIGDLLLKEVAKRIHACLRRESDTMSRIGGDEFVILLAQIEEVQDALVAAEKVLFALKQRFAIGLHTIDISSSIGIAVYPQHGEDADLLLKNADNAMYQAKRSGRNCCRFFSTGTERTGT